MDKNVLISGEEKVKSVSVKNFSNKEIESLISKFLSGQKVLSLATISDGQPYCSAIFYVFDAKLFRFYFMSSVNSRHCSEFIIHPRVAGTVISGELEIDKLKGVQFTGRILEKTFQTDKLAFDKYFSAIPFAKGSKDEIWTLEIDYIKMTDNSFGFGTKFIWKRSDID